MDKRCPIQHSEFCTKEKCAWWDEEKSCCVCLTFMLAGSKQGEEALQTMLKMLGGNPSGN
jgi:hypothetical protein